MSEYDNEPIGDKRWVYHNMYRKAGMVWGGPKPDQFSPKTRAEEITINEALLEGTLEPRNEYERRFLDLMGGPHPKADRPKKWVVCKICGSEYQATGYPAGPTFSALVDSVVAALDVNKKGQPTKPEVQWLYPNICLACADYREAKPAPPLSLLDRERPATGAEKGHKPRQKNLPYKDPE